MARASVNSIAIRAIGAAFGLGFNILLSRTLGVSGTGAVMFYLSFASQVGLLATAGMDVVGMRELSRHADDASRSATILGHVICNALLSTLLFAFGGFFVAWLFNGAKNGSASLLTDVVCALILLLTAFQKMFSDWLVALRDFYASQLVLYFTNRLSSLGLGVVIIAFVGSAGASTELFICVYAFGLILAVTYAFRRVSSHVAWREIARKLSPAMPLFRDGVSCGIQNTTFVLLNLSPFLLLGVLSTTSELALFGVSQRLVVIIILALTTISQFAMRDFSQAFGFRNYALLSRAMTDSVRLTILASIGLTIPLVVFAHFWVLIFGREFAPARAVLAILSIGICTQCLGMPFQAVLFATNNERSARNVTVFCTIVGITLNALLVIVWGARGAAVGTGIGLALQSLGHAACVFRKLPVRFDFAALRVVANPAETEM